MAVLRVTLAAVPVESKRMRKGEWMHAHHEEATFMVDIKGAAPEMVSELSS